MKIIRASALSAAGLLFIVSCASPPPPPVAPKPEPTPVAIPEPAPVPAPEPLAPVAPAFKDVVTSEPLPVSLKTYYPNGDSSGSVTTTYNAKGQLLTQETTNPNGVLVETRTGKAKGDLWRITTTNAQTGEVLAFEDRLYSDEGDLLSQTFMNAKEVQQSANEYVWKEGKKTQWTAKLGANGNTQAKTLYLYDANGNNSRVEVYDAGNKLVTVYENTYNAAGQIQVRKGLDNSGVLVEQTNFSWKGNQKVKEETIKPLLRTLDYTYSDDTTAPTGIASSVRGRLAEKQVLIYTWIKYTHRVPNKE